MKNFRMSEVQALESVISWSGQAELDRNEKEEINQLIHGRSIQYASVDNPRSFCADMKPSTGRLMDFNKGISVHST